MNRFEPYLEILKKAVVDLDQWRDSFGHPEGREDTERMREIEKAVLAVAHRLKGNYPFHHPQYAGQMLKPPHPAAWLAYALTMSINPNNHALDGGPPTAEMEQESVQMLGEMVGYEKPFLGHLTSGEIGRASCREGVLVGGCAVGGDIAGAEEGGVGG